MEEVSRLQEALDTARNGKREALEQCEATAREADEALHQLEALQEAFQASEIEKADVSYGYLRATPPSPRSLVLTSAPLQLQRFTQEQQVKIANERKVARELRQLLDERADEFDGPRKNGSFEQLSPSTMNGHRRDSIASNSSKFSRMSNGKDDTSTMQITGLK